jgi:uncharacterized membrane protein YqjE
MTGAGSGLMGSVKRLAITLISIVSTRLELLADELQEERLRQTQMFLLGLSMFFCAGMFVLLLVFLMVILFWDDHRLAALGVLSTLFFGLSEIMAVLLCSKAKSRSKPFSASLAKFTRDREQLGASHETTDA